MRVNAKGRLLALLLAFSMIFTGLGIGQWGLESVWADSDEITVTVNFDASVVAEDLDQLKKDMTDTGLIEETTTGLPEQISVTVPKDSTVKQVLQAAKAKQSFTIEGLDDEYVTQVGFISSDNLANLVNTTVGSYTSGNVFASAGWSFYINGQPLSSGIGVDKVTENNSVVSGCYNLYGTWSSSDSKMVYYDEPLIKNYNDLKALINKSVDLTSYTDEEKSAYNGAKSEAQALITEMYNDAKLTGEAASTLKEANEDFHTDGGMWIGYIETKQSAIWGPDSITEKLDKAKIKLQKAIDKELVVKESEKADLVSLSVAKYSNDEVLKLTPEFDAATQNYSVAQLSNSETGFALKATSKAEGATITAYVNGTKKQTVTSGSSNWAYIWNCLNTGDNKVEVVVTPPDGDTTKNKTYTITIPRAKSSESLLKSITLKSGNYKTLQYAHKNKADGTLFRVSSDGEETGTTGFSADTFTYNTYVSESVDAIKLTLTGKNSGAVISVKDKDNNETAYKSGTAGSALKLDKGDNKYTITVESEDGTGKSVYNLNVIRVTGTPELRTIDGEGLQTEIFDGLSSLNLYYKDGEATRTAKVTTSDGAYVYLGSLSTDKLLANNEFTVDSTKFNSYGIQTVTLYVSQSNEGKASEPYAKYTVNVNKMFSVEGNADEVVSYICPASQYTNAANYGIFINKTLTGALTTGYYGACTSLGNFGGEVVYKFNTPITNSAKHAYGIDFIVYGNSNGGTSFSEPGNVYVSKDGQKWYSLAGSEHFEDSTITDYELTYYSDENGTNTTYTDNQGVDTPTSVSTANRQFPDAGLYSKFKGLTDELKVKGVLIQKGGNTVTEQCAYGYADVHKNGSSIGTAVNPYVANHFTAVTGGDGMDLDWAVDENGQPVELDEINYVKVQTATLIDGGAIGEKSTEIGGVYAVKESEEAVGKTAALEGVTISDESGSIPVKFEENKNVYNINIGSKKYFSITPQGGESTDNIYINNQRLTYSDGFSSAEGFKVTKDNPKTVRVLVQNGTKEPTLYTLNITGSAEESDDMIEGITVNCDGANRKAVKGSDGVYTLNVGNAITSAKIIAETDPANTVKINDAAVQDTYQLNVGKNSFDIEVSKGDKTEKATLKITRQEAPSTSEEKINVTFTLYGDTHHSESTTHVFSTDKSKLPCWISSANVEVTKGATVKTAIEKALNSANISYTNKSGNYISEVNGLKEFDNGPLSGWMYSINGKEPLLGVNEQILNAGDTIILYYTDDYTKEANASEWSSPEEQSKTAELNASASVEDAKAKVNLTAAEIDKLISSASSTKAEELNINVTDAENVIEIELKLPKKSMEDMASKAGINLVVNTSNGSIILTPAVMKSVAAQAEGSEISIIIRNVKNTDSKLQKKIGSNALLKEVIIKSGDKEIKTFGGNKITVSFELDENLAAKTLTGVRIDKDNKLTELGGKVVTRNGKKYFDLNADQLSTYAVAEKSVVEETVAAQEKAEYNAKIKAGVQKTKITNLKAKATKGKVTLTWKKSKGYKVDGYRIYKATKKSGKYTRIATVKKSLKYTNKKGLKKGKTYYYKVRGYRTVNGKLVFTGYSKIIKVKAK